MQKLTFQQVRAIIARNAARAYSPDQLVQLLQRSGYSKPIASDDSAVSLAYKLAWLLLPADRRSA